MIQRKNSLYYSYYKPLEKEITEKLGDTSFETITAFILAKQDFTNEIGFLSDKGILGARIIELFGRLHEKVKKKDNSKI